MQRSKFLLAAVLAATAIFTGPAASRADFSLSLTTGTGLGASSAELDFTASGIMVGNNTLHIASGTALATLINSGVNPNLYFSGGTSSTNGQTAATISGLVFEGYTFQVSAVSSNNPGNSVLGTLSIQNFSIKNTGNAASPLQISLFEDGFTAPSPNRFMVSSFTATLQDSPGVNVNESSVYSDGSNTLTNTSPTFSNDSNAATMTSGNVSSNASYSLSDTIVVTGLGNGMTLDDANDDASIYAPAPSGLILAATMVPFVGLLRRRLRQSVVVASAT